MKNVRDSKMAFRRRYKPLHVSPERVAYRNGLSDRARVLCFGMLALIWAIFSQKRAEQVILVGGWQRNSLLCIGFLAVVALFLDFLEYAFAFQSIREEPPRFLGRLTRKMKMNPGKWGRWARNMRITKVFLTIIAALWFCSVLGWALKASLN